MIRSIPILILLLLGPIGCMQSPPMLNVRALGARGDGKTKDTVAFQTALDECDSAGGGEVIVPAGNYLIGSISIGSRTMLQLQREANLMGSGDLSDYALTEVRWEGKWVHGHRALICATNADHIAIVGPGKITGNPAVGGRHTPRGPVLIEPVNCTNVALEDFSTSQRGLWSIHPVYCRNVEAKNLTIRSVGGNGDGIDIDSCEKVCVDSCNIDTGDDCIAIKSGRGMEGNMIGRPSQDILIRNCTLGDAGFACIGIGSETSGGLSDVHIEHCTFTHSKTYSIYIKSRPGRGAGIENISATDLRVLSSTGGFLRINLLSSGIQDSQPVAGEAGIPFARNFSFTDAVVNGGTLIDAASISPIKPLIGLTISHISGTCGKGMNLANMRDVSIEDVNVSGFAGPLISKENVVDAVQGNR